MDEEKYTRNKGGPREKGKPEGESKEGGSYGGKLKSENTRSESMKSKYESGRKKPEGKSKLKKTGSGKTSGEKTKKKIGIKPPLPAPPQIGSTNFTANEHKENLDASEETRDFEGNAGVLISAALLMKGKYTAPDHSEWHDWKNVKEGKQLSGTEQNNPRFRKNMSIQDANSQGNSPGNGPKAHWKGEGEGYSGKLSEGKYVKDLSGTRFEEAEPEGSNPTSRQWQKRSTQKKIMSRNQSGSSSSSSSGPGFFGTVAAKIEVWAKQMGQAVMVFVKENPVIWIIGGASCIGILGASGATTSMGLMLMGGNNVVVTTSFTAEDETILAVEEDYRDLEEDLRDQIDNIESDNPGYDEYNYHLDPIEHNGVELAAFLTVLHEAYSEEEVQGTLKQIINGQYDLSAVGRTEIRTKTVTKWHWVTKEREEERTGFKLEGGRIVPYTYTVTVSYDALESYEDEVEYEYKIMDITLTGQAITDYAKEVLTEDQMERYKLLILTKGNKEELFT